MKKALFCFALLLLINTKLDDLRAVENVIPLKDYIIGADDRIIVTKKDFPWSAIGKIESESRLDSGECTGSLVGENLVLTAAHCLFTESGLQARRIYFSLGPENGEFKHRTRVVETYLPEQFNIRLSESSKRQAKLDWAILVLAEPVGAEFGYFDVLEIEKILDRLPCQCFTRAGYSADDAKSLKAHVQCAVTRTGFQDSVIYHECDGMPGDSGSPIWYSINGRPTVVGIFGSILFEETIKAHRATRGIGASKDFVPKVIELRTKYQKK